MRSPPVTRSWLPASRISHRTSGLSQRLAFLIVGRAERDGEGLRAQRIRRALPKSCPARSDWRPAFRWRASSGSAPKYPPRHVRVGVHHDILVNADGSGEDRVAGDLSATCIAMPKMLPHSPRLRKVIFQVAADSGVMQEQHARDFDALNNGRLDREDQSALRLGDRLG